MSTVQETGADTAAAPPTALAAAPPTALAAAPPTALAAAPPTALAAAPPTALAAAPPTALAAPPPTCRHKKGRRLPHLDHCLNCGRPTGPSDNFCPNCGQENEDETVRLRPLVADALSEMASWDSKFVRTVLPLLFRPGFLTNEFLAGRRVRYLSPLKMYLVVSALFFLVMSHNSHVKIGDRGAPGVTFSTGTHTSRPAKPVPKPKQIQADEDDKGNTEIFGRYIDPRKLPPTVAAYDARQRDPRNRRPDSPAWQLLMRQFIKAKEQGATFKQSVAAAMLDTIPKMMFLLLPAFALLLKLTYFRTKRFYVEHLIFALHTHAFGFVAFGAALLFTDHGDSSGAALGVAFLLVSIYFFVAMRRVYRQGWIKTFFVSNWLAFNYLILLAVALGLAAIVAFLLA